VNYPATLLWEYIPKDSPRVYAPDFKPFTEPKTKELTSGSVEKMLLGD
jgi:hypothetical protein